MQTIPRPTRASAYCCFKSTSACKDSDLGIYDVSLLLVLHLCFFFKFLPNLHFFYFAEITQRAIYHKVHEQLYLRASQAALPEWCPLPDDLVSSEHHKH